MIICVLIVIFCTQILAQNDKIIFGKKDFKKTTLPKRHPASDYFSKQYQSYQADAKSPNFNKLLVLLVDFQEDNNPNTTGNGKFVTSPDTSYKFIIDSPPRNRQYYETHMEALKYYYRAVSYENYQLDYNVYPKNQQAYTLPHEMAYYHPANSSSSLFISRIEEYFHDVFTVADLDPEIVFANYDHYMIIHAGSDWQHDTQGNSPSDLPSFFIRVGTGKEVIVDDGATIISYACNVTETITQDTYESIEGDYTYVYGYGAVNAVFAHEFGHSLGLVDLYNTANSRPMVGVFDIMDSGGQGQITIPDADIPNKYYAIEGALPAMPGAWSRNLIFGDIYKEKGITRSLSTKYVDFGNDQLIRAAETKYIPDNIPNFYEIPLNDKEYLLIENRSIDPDGDGGTSMKSALNGRIALYPCPYVGEDFTYEYDWLLPSWMDMNGNWYGGGLLIWHIDNQRLFDTGFTGSDGEFVSNFENNSVNTFFAKRSVRVIEADNLPDLGNPASWFWTGTAYEFFFRNKPVLDQNGMFVQWSSDIHNDSLSAFTKPALYTNDNKPSSWAIHSISEAKPVMSFKISNTIFDNTIRLLSPDSLNFVSPVINFVADTASDMMISGDNESLFLSHNYSSSDDSWSSFWTYDVIFNPTFPALKVDLNQNGSETLIIIEDNKLSLVSQNIYQEKLFSEPVKENPVVFYKNSIPYILIPFENKSDLYKMELQGSTCLFTLETTTALTGKLIASDQYFAILSEKQFSILNHEFALLKSTILEDSHTIYEPVCFQNNSNSDLEFYIMSDSGTLRKITYNNSIKTQIIFETSQYTQKHPSQIALAVDLNHQLNISFGADNKVFVIYNDGTFAPGFPMELNHFSIKEDSFVTTLKNDSQLISIFNDSKSGIVGVNHQAEISLDYTMSWQKGQTDPVWFKETQSNRLYLLYTDMDNNVYLSWKPLSSNSDIAWNAYRNSLNGFCNGNILDMNPANLINAYVYPNPVMKSNARIRIENAKADIKIKIYNINGDIVYENLLEKTSNIFQDCQINVSNYSSGVYFAILSDGINQKKRIKFAVVK